jgi:hypothetical protein
MSENNTDCIQTQAESDDGDDYMPSEDELADILIRC